MSSLTLPKGGNGETIPLPPAKVAVSTSVQTVDSSTTFAITAGAGFIEVSALAQAAYLKWGATTVTSSNFDHTIQSGATRHLIIPIDQSTGLLYTTIRIIGQAAGSTVAMTQF